MGLVETRAGTPQLPLMAPSFTSYRLKRKKNKRKKEGPTPSESATRAL